MHEAVPEHSPLGKAVTYRDQYAPELLFPIPRLGKRQEIGIEGRLPFMGADLWTAYELSWLNRKGKPQVALATIVIPADSPNLIESKSFKLYLNSYNQTQLSGSDELQTRLVQDLSAAAGASVSVRLHLPDTFTTQRMHEQQGILLDTLDIEVDHYQPDPQLLQLDEQAETGAAPVEETLVSHLLKSNCLVTGQPDWGSVQIHYVGPQINHESVLRYLIGFRQHNEFHEQCVERIFMDISRQCHSLKLTVYARYTRRGGLDINPFRTNVPQALPDNVRTARQ
ncbi:NADPH-dependent 7-cyano-7-deazaguanine reductase QueF [Leeia aquatica]|uniref:NADPH-dependent 7-cyano-7-deazaguanine reductase n=1 Tax=Leeia aquatica TaxID=2725557 RepID=A0A847S718_9NEIS|nr:NADPH-dependent 7-cyano-7-deazaguanine reductase QueF [Leeia aquatica]NLR75543.1 NADPH-dependent 7-cyano-7-deazaguanine reductase QueF [Leeia aquatica]